MLYDFNVSQMTVEGHSFWYAKSSALKGCVGQGDTIEEAVSELEDNESEWIISAKKYGIPIPPVKIEKPVSFSGKLMLRVSPLVHEDASFNSKYLHISLNQYLSDAIVTYNAVVKQKIRWESITNMSGTMVFPDASKNLDLQSTNEINLFAA